MFPAIVLDHLDPLFLIIGYDITLFGSNFETQNFSFMLVTSLISIGVKNQAPQVSFKLVVGDSMLVSSHEFVDMKYCDFMDILKVRLDYRDYTFYFLSLLSSPHIITCSSPLNKDGDLLHSIGHLLLTYGAEFTSHGSMFKAATS